MRRLSFVLTAILSLALYSCCGSVEIIDGSWSINRVLDLDASEIDGEDLAFHFDSKENRVVIHTACNIINATYIQDGKNLTFTDGLSTKMACPDMRMEDACSQALVLVKSFVQKDEKLVMMDDADNVIIELSKISE